MTTSLDIDVARHSITRFKVSGSSGEPTSIDRWLYESKAEAILGNDINSNFVAKGLDLDKYFGTVTRQMKTLANGQVVEGTDLLYVIFTGDGKIGFTFFNH